MRFDKRYPVIPTLLTRIFWWRVCLDEAQMVESNAAAATEMALRLHAKHRWCITGTPIQRKLDDLYGLLKFLTASPFEVRRWWVEVIKDPYERRDAGAIEFAHKFFKNIMWRSMKVQVADELQLPPQEEWLCWLLFSPIEAHFYQKQHETCLSYAHEFVRSFKEGVHKRKFGGSQSCEAADDIVLTHVEAAKLFHSLLKLRQACCHPQVGNSGLRSLQHSPMTMEEILGVLVGKSKIEGEEALRISVMALNALAGIAIIEEDLPRALSLYRESLTLAAEHCDDFHLDPLVNIHLHHNLAEIFPDNSGKLDEVQSMDWKFLQNAEEMALRLSGKNNFDEHSAKRQKITDESSSHSTSNEGYLEQQGKNSSSDLSIVGSNGDEVIEYGGPPLNTGKSIKDCLRLASKKVEHKYLAMHVSKLSQAQREFRDIYMQVCSAIGDLKNEHKAWWLEALHHIEKNEDSSKKCISKVQDTLFGNLNIPTQSRLASRFRSISGLKYVIQSSLDSLESSRVMLIERILEIDKTMEKPRDEDILLVRYCGSCQDNGKGPICVRCELRSLFQLYEAQLFLCTKEGRGGREIEVISAEEAVDIQKKNSALNQFHTGVSRTKIDSSSPAFQSEKIKMQRAVRETVKVMRKEYAPASTLATVQGQLLFAHDEVRMSISRLHLRESENDTSRDALTPEELVAASVQNTSDKIMGLSMLSRIKGQFRYLKEHLLLVYSTRDWLFPNKSRELESPNSSMHVDTDSSASTSQTREIDECIGKADDEACPVCHENLSDQRIVFQCGHVTCCKCLIAMSKHQLSPPGNTDDEWVMCPTCRQRTDFRNIAYADTRRNCARKSRIPTTFQGHEKPEASIDVQGSYGTKKSRDGSFGSSVLTQRRKCLSSSWNDVLDVLEHALAANQISYIKMKGGRKSHLAITQFEGHCANEEGTGMRCGQQPGTKSFQVMLLLIQHGANGLNLLKAKHVILIEPLLNPAAEAQAINRVHRIGQDKPTVVHRFIAYVIVGYLCPRLFDISPGRSQIEVCGLGMKDTVEESIYNWNRSKTSKTIISGNTKCQDKPVLTLKDVESLFSLTTPVNPPERENKPTESLMHLPPTVAAALAAERRWKEGLA
ncbi:hypothetical protein IFM89_005358 [Coptis chinensis]|uniref:RING-type domain-containing protein n=1 Tax=Coptis chinensis TaxID=261450 RepID=A0A835HCM5_9MAGN|nr:hypothetical protein IFM89_005358 [Coptis chinensis]